ncbi:nuclear transport factor 2 family protein [Variovorax atrisoli]|uniref:nuclear transport factor 2 family protein n=1 Tax=Variovorax atrisoli TaxID=3394203 RepID=UPI000F7F1B5F|nr:nuclear transport factor 2 family protein [Variovorax sp. 369]RTD85047.1 nuclear transport factor 2 family protein [Variovorax sp. 369]
MSTIKAAVDDLLNNRQLTAAEALDRHFGPTFRQRTNGRWDDRAAVLARAIQLRDVVEHATITVLDELAVGDRYAERHLIDLRHRDGTRTVQEVYLFAERDADGRFTRIEEAAVVWRD